MMVAMVMMILLKHSVFLGHQCRIVVDYDDDGDDDGDGAYYCWS